MQTRAGWGREVPLPSHGSVWDVVSRAKDVPWRTQQPLSVLCLVLGGGSNLAKQHSAHQSFPVLLGTVISPQSRTALLESSGQTVPNSPVLGWGGCCNPTLLDLMLSNWWKCFLVCTYLQSRLLEPWGCFSSRALINCLSGSTLRAWSQHIRALMLRLGGSVPRMKEAGAVQGAHDTPLPPHCVVQGHPQKQALLFQLPGLYPGQALGLITSNLF